MEIGIAKVCDVMDPVARAEEIQWCKKCIQMKIEHEGLVEGVDYDWKDLKVKVYDGKVELRLPIMKLL